MGNATSHAGHRSLPRLPGGTERDGAAPVGGTVDIVGALPDDVAFQVLDHLDFDDLERVKQVCRCGQTSLRPAHPAARPPPPPPQPQPIGCARATVVGTLGC